MNVDIAISFNDVTPPKNIGMVLGSKPAYYEQLLFLLKSIKKNWDREIHDYKVRVYYSKNISREKIEKLQSLGCTTIYNPEEVQPLLCRENIFNDKYEDEGDYTLVLDTDMIVLNTPTLHDKKDIYVKPSPNQLPKGMTREKWKIANEKMGVTHDDKVIQHFNCGLILISNKVKKRFYDYYMCHLETLKLLESYHRHLSIQLYYSILIRKFNWGILDEKSNVFSSYLKNKKYSPDLPIDILHYLGKSGFNEEVKKILKNL